MSRMFTLGLLALTTTALASAPPDADESRLIIFIPGPTLTVSAVISGAQARLTATEFEPGETIHFLGSVAGVGSGACLPSGPCTDLLDPVQIVGKADANADGWASVVVDVPAALTDGTALYFQAAALRGAAGVDSVTTPAVTAFVGPVGCIALYAPVCGIDGNTYGNSCEANVMGWPVDYGGACIP